MNIRLEPELKRRLDLLAEWQTQEIQEAIKEAEAGDFAAEQTVNKTLEKWGINTAYPNTGSYHPVLSRIKV